LTSSGVGTYTSRIGEKVTPTKEIKHEIEEAVKEKHSAEISGAGSS
jgi:hypothetical protein